MAAPSFILNHTPGFDRRCTPRNDEIRSSTATSSWTTLTDPSSGLGQPHGITLDAATRRTRRSLRRDLHEVVERPRSAQASSSSSRRCGPLRPSLRRSPPRSRRDLLGHHAPRLGLGSCCPAPVVVRAPRGSLPWRSPVDQEIGPGGNQGQRPSCFVSASVSILVWPCLGTLRVIRRGGAPPRGKRGPLDRRNPWAPLPDGSRITILCFQMRGSRLGSAR